MSLSGALKRKLAALKKEKEAENQSFLSRCIKKQKPSPCEPVQQVCNSESEQTIATVPSSSNEVMVPQIKQAGNKTPQGTATLGVDEEYRRSSGPTDISLSSLDQPPQTRLVKYPAYGYRPFIDLGVRKWRDISSVFEQNTGSDRHKNNAVSWTKFKDIQTKDMQPIASVLITDRNKEIKENREHVKTLLKVTALLGRLGTAFRGHDETESSTNKLNFVETCNLLAEYSPTFFNKLQRRYGHYTSHEYQNDLIW
ncbi:hypothetical protein QYM36_008566 [Artemia franciscana]|uniref:DUF4371 domain-containing protein n=1 Tax=Artemia franciscana TaxID=6661 RepID=A0AA88HQY4_ARTSF|nr:hypothetical protein QYM36_008566 [Artemia franciscana]